MDFLSAGTVGRLEQYFDQIGAILGNDERRASFATYAMGLFSDAERKSVEPMAVRACPDPAVADAAHQRLLHFVANSPWNDLAVRREAARHALAELTAREAVQAWVLDDTGWLKQGKHSVGVQRQYTGTAGKVANCQIGASLSVVTETEQLPIDFELYLPKSWTDSRRRRKEGKIPDDVVFKTKPELAIQMVRRALDDGVPPGAVLADSAYGSSREFRRELRELGLSYVAAINPTTKVAVINSKTKRCGRRTSVRDLAGEINADGGFRRCTWREGTKRDLWARFALRHVRISDEEDALLLIEWRNKESAPANYFLIHGQEARALKKLVRLVMQRWRTERVYQDLKGELGLDHYEGRSYRGWHHHVSVVLCCYAFILSERVRHFPPSARRPVANGTHTLAA